MRSAACLIVGAATVLGCAGGAREIHDQPPARPAVPIAASFGKTWDAVMAEFTRKPSSITTKKRSSGLIIAETSVPTRTATKSTGWVLVSNNYADCVPDKDGRRDPHVAIYTVRIKGDSVASTLLVSVEWFRDSQVRAQDVTMSEVPISQAASCPGTGVGEREFEMRIKRSAEGLVR